jgi:hypothetical protein
MRLPSSWQALLRFLSLSTPSDRETTYVGGFQPPTTIDTCRFFQPLRVLTSPKSCLALLRVPFQEVALALRLKLRTLLSLFHPSCILRVAPFRGFPDLEPDTSQLALPLFPSAYPGRPFVVLALRRNSTSSKPSVGSALRPASARTHRLRRNLGHCCHRVRGGRSSVSCSHAGKTGAVSRPRPLGPRSDIASRSLPCGWDACAQRAGPDGLVIVAACAAALPEGVPDLPDRGVPRGWVALSITFARKRKLRTGTPALHRHLIVRRQSP